MNNFIYHECHGLDVWWCLYVGGSGSQEKICGILMPTVMHVVHRNRTGIVHHGNSSGPLRIFEALIVDWEF
jgi:hypothetical protein